MYSKHKLGSYLMKLDEKMRLLMQIRVIFEILAKSLKITVFHYTLLLTLEIHKKDFSQHTHIIFQLHLGLLNDSAHLERFLRVRIFRNGLVLKLAEFWVIFKQQPTVHIPPLFSTQSTLKIYAPLLKSNFTINQRLLPRSGSFPMREPGPVV